MRCVRELTALETRTERANEDSFVLEISLSQNTGEWLQEVHQELTHTGLTLDVPGVEGHRKLRSDLVQQIDDYLLPRLSNLDAPLLTVVGGSTGAGKSTLVNSLVGKRVSKPGVLRPTTRSPVLVCHPDDVSWFSDDRVFPGLRRITGDGSGQGSSLVLVSHDALPPGVAILDSPDIDSVAEANRALATKLLAAADLWLFVTTAARYADAVPWEFLDQARQRSTAMALVLNRVPPGAEEEVQTHLEAMLSERGIGGTRVFVIQETELSSGDLPQSQIAPVHAWLHELVDDAETRTQVIRQTLAGALASVPNRVLQVAEHRDAQAEAARALSDSVRQAYGKSLDEIDKTLGNGSLLRAEVLARWQDLVGTGDIMRTLQTSIGRIRDRFTAFLTGRSSAEAEVRGEIESALTTLIVGQADEAAANAVDSWAASATGRQLLGEDARALGRPSADLRDRVNAEIREWERDLLELVRGAGQSKRLTARALSLGINTVGVALMVLIFAHTGGLTGVEIGVAGGTATMSQALLSALFGEQAVRDLATEARRRLLARVTGLMEDEAARLHDRVTEARGPGGQAEALRTLAKGAPES